jgi:hypothetical protein
MSETKTYRLHIVSTGFGTQRRLIVTCGDTKVEDTLCRSLASTNRTATAYRERYGIRRAYRWPSRDAMRLW